MRTFRLQIITVLLIFISFQNVTLAATPNGVQTADEISQFTIEQLPAWADEYKSTDVANGGGYLKIDLLMSTYSISRMQAVLLQAAFRRGIRINTTANRIELFNASLAEARAYQAEFVNIQKIESAKFIVVFDLDETLYFQKIKPEDENCADVSYVKKDGTKKLIRTTPHAIDTIKKINQIGGTVILFSANLEEETRNNLKAWKFADGSDLLTSSLIAGVFTNDHLIFQGTSPKTPPVLTTSKDLRIFDETLQKVIIVDDNPMRLFQSKNVRLFRNFNGTLACKNPSLQKAFENSLDVVFNEIKESVTYLKTHPMASFSTAYLPYTYSGKLSADWLFETSQVQKKSEAIDYVRNHPEMIDPRFP